MERLSASAPTGPSSTHEAMRSGQLIRACRATWVPPVQPSRWKREWPRPSATSTQMRA